MPTPTPEEEQQQDGYKNFQYASQATGFIWETALPKIWAVVKGYFNKMSKHSRTPNTPYHNYQADRSENYPETVGAQNIDLVGILFIIVGLLLLVLLAATAALAAVVTPLLYIPELFYMAGRKLFGSRGDTVKKDPHENRNFVPSNDYGGPGQTSLSARPLHGREVNPTEGQAPDGTNQEKIEP